LAALEPWIDCMCMPGSRYYRLRLERIINPTTANMLLSKLLLLPVAVASSVTIYMHSVPSSSSSQTPVDQPKGTVTSFTPPHGSYTNEHLLRVGLHDSASGAWRGIVTSAANFADQYKKKFVIFVDEKGEVYHVGFSTSAKGGDKEDVYVQVVKRAPGMKPVLNKPIVLNAEGKLAAPGVEEKTFLQK
jgi:hypothetical protein